MAARAEAYDPLSQPAKVRSTVRQVTEAASSVDLPLRVELLTRAAMNGLEFEEVDRIASSLSSALEPQAYRLRADVNRATGRTEAAYRKLERSVHLEERRYAYERSRQAAVLRARRHRIRVSHSGAEHRPAKASRDKKP